MADWSTKLEDLLDGGKTQEAQQLLEALVEELQGREDAATSLTLAAALSDLASLYETLGLSSKAHSAASSALLIKDRAQLLLPPRNATSSATSKGDVDDHPPRNRGQTKCDASSCTSNCEEDWESLLSEGLTKLDGLSPAKAVPEATSSEKSSSKQRRGRGAFTCGEMGMYSDRLTKIPFGGSQQDDISTDESSNVDLSSSVQTKDFALLCGLRHVLEVSFSPTVVTKDLEELLEPFASDGLFIRWLNDTTAMAVFPKPEIAKKALQSITNSDFKIKYFTEESAFAGLVNERDLQPPIPRPPTSSQAAHRMIMGALQRQGIRKKSLPSSSFESSQKQELERKQRLLTRQKLRDEAWGSDD